MKEFLFMFLIFVANINCFSQSTAYANIFVTIVEAPIQIKITSDSTVVRKDNYMAYTTSKMDTTYIDKIRVRLNAKIINYN